MRNKAKLLIIMGMLLFVVSAVFSQDAIIRQMTGTVEIKKAGSTAWETAVPGQTVPVDTVISTGFKSYALISIGSSVMNVRPLTRLSISEIKTSHTTEAINVNLQAGRVRTDVNPPAGTKVSFATKAPPATASVRGTVFEMGVFELWVIEGSVEYRGTSGAPVIIDAVGYSYVDERTGRAVFAKEMRISNLSPDQPIAFDSFHSFTGAAQQSREIDITGGMEFGN